MTPDAILDALVDVAPAIIARQAKPGGRCVLATSVGLKVLEYFQIPAVPLFVNVAVFNAGWERWIRSGHTGDPRTFGAWAVIIEASNPGPNLSGHVLIRVTDPTCLIDLDLQQFQRPAKGLYLPDAGRLPWPGDGRRHVSYGLPEDGTLTYQFRDQAEWPAIAAAAPDWQRGLDGTFKPLIGEIIRAVKKRLP